MPVGQAGAGEDSAPVDTSISLDDFAADVFGDLPDEAGESPPVVGSDAAGTTPAERQQTTVENLTSPEGQAEAARAGTTPVDAAKAGPDKGTPTKSPEPDVDPLATATPFTYSVQGQDKTFEGIKVLGDAGAIITPEALVALSQHLSDGERFHTTSREQYDQIKDLERLSEWKTLGTDGKEQTMSGREGLSAMRSDFESLKAAFDTFVQVLKPAADGSYPLLTALVDVDPKTNQIVASPAFVEQLLERSANAEFRARVGVKERLAEITKAPQTTSGRSAAPATELDPVRLQAQAPRVIDLALQQAKLDLKLLTPEDRAFLQEQFTRYVRAVTEEERRNDPNLRTTQHITDGSFAQLVARQANHRKELAQTAAATKSASDENAAKLAAAALGKRAQPSTTRPQERQPTAEQSRATDADKAWAQRERLASGRFSS